MRRQVRVNPENLPHQSSNHTGATNRAAAFAWTFSGCTFHTHRTIHWGSAGRSSAAVPPRVALSFGASDGAFGRNGGWESFDSQRLVLS